MVASTNMKLRNLSETDNEAHDKRISHKDGDDKLPDTIKKLNYRDYEETNRLTALSMNNINTTLVWGLHDNVSPVRVANFVWRNFLHDKPGRNRYWILPSADHYLQCDAPAQLAEVVRITAAGETTALCTLGNAPDGAVLVDQTV
jgi:pimeloyl-ACP methyl ester carboxylesterase